MKKLLVKDKKRRHIIKNKEKFNFILKSISENSNFFKLIRWNAFCKLKNLDRDSYKTKVSNRCVDTIHKKRLNKYTCYSRHVYLKLIRSGSITGMQKSSW